MLAGDLLYLFRGNPNVVGLDRAKVDADGEDVPGPLRLEPDMLRQQWHVLMEGHLAGSGGIGVYPYNHELKGVAWGCVDFDEGELPSWSYALDVRIGLHELGITGFIERSRSKGYHVWVFFGGWVPAGLVRRALIGVCQAVNAPTKEVNPKSVTLQPGQLGNFVRLPYKGAGDRPTVAPHLDARQVVVDDLGRPLSPALFASMALDSALSVHELARAAKSVHVEPEPTQRPLRANYGGPWKDQLAPLAQAELANGPLPGQDRSGYLAGFAHACRESGLCPEDAEKAIRLADYLHGRKYTDRNDADKRYGELVTRAYNAQEGSMTMPEDEVILDESTSDDERRIRVYDPKGDFIITVPAKARITFGYFNPTSPGGTEGPRDGYRYGADNVARQTALRIYRTKEDQLACFIGVRGFRDLSIALTRYTQKVTVERRYERDEEHDAWGGMETRELVAKTEDEYL